MITKLKYGNTNTYFVDGLLINTDYAGTLPAFYKEIKKNRIAVIGIKYILATHYYPDHIGLISEFISTISHSEDGAAVILDDGNCFVGDLEPSEFIDAYVSNRALQEDWKRILSYNPVTIHYGHANEKRLH